MQLQYFSYPPAINVAMENTRTKWKLRSLGKHRTGELSSHVWWHRRLLIYHTWVKNWQIYAKARAMKWGLLVDYHRFTLPMSFQWRRRTIRVSATKLLALKMAMHLAGEALHITAYLHIPTYKFKYRCVCVYIHRKYMYPYRQTYIYIHTIPYH